MFRATSDVDSKYGPDVGSNPRLKELKAIKGAELSEVTPLVTFGANDPGRAKRTNWLASRTGMPLPSVSANKLVHHVP